MIKYFSLLLLAFAAPLALAQTSTWVPDKASGFPYRDKLPSGCYGQRSQVAIDLDMAKQ
jgi:hypothetical protein